MSSYTDLTTEFDFKDLLTWQNMDALAENDNYLYNNLAAYRRPVLQFISVSLIDVENNTGVSNQTSVMFPDGSIRSVTEDTAVTTKYRRFDITAAASFTSGTEDSGLRSGLVEAANTWYAIYAVKSSVDTSKFVLAGDTTLPLAANFATLNTRYGTNGWLYLGMVRNGDNSGATSDLLDFVQTGNQTRFKNTCAANVVSCEGLLLSGSAGGFADYTYAAGTGTTNIPDHCTIAEFVHSSNATTSTVQSKNHAATRVYCGYSGRDKVVMRHWSAASEGCLDVNGNGVGVGSDIFLGGWLDNVLGVGSNPVL